METSDFVGTGGTRCGFDDMFWPNSDNEFFSRVSLKSRMGHTDAGRYEQVLAAQADRLAVLRQDAGIEIHGRRPDESSHEHVHGMVVEILRSVTLLQDSASQDGHPITHGHGLDLIVGDVDGGHSQAPLNP